MILRAQGVTVTVAEPQEPKMAIKQAPPQKVVEEDKEVPTVQIEESTAISYDEIPFDEPPVSEDFIPEIPEENGVKEIVEKKEISQPAPQPKKVDTGIVTDTDNAVPFAAWENTLNQLSKISRPLYPMLIGSTAFRAGNTVFIKAKNTAFSQMFTQKMHADAIAEALMRATGEKLKPMIYNDGASPAADETAEPIDAFLSKLNKHNIDFIIEE